VPIVIWLWQDSHVSSGWRLAPVSLFAWTLLGSCGRPAWAYDASVSATHDAQFYAVNSPFGSPELLRRRHTSTLGLSVLDIGGSGGRGARFDFRARLRLDADFGQAGTERDPASLRFVPGLEQAPFDLMYAYLDAAGLCSGALGFRLGRQLVVDPIGFFAFDGARISLSLPLELELGGFAGVEPRPGLPMLATARYTGDGVARGDRDGFDPSQAPWFLEESALAPAYGAFFTARSLGPVSASLHYRKVLNRSRVRTAPFTVDPSALPASFAETRTSSERVAGSAELRLWGAATASGRAVYDLYRDQWTALVVGARAFPTSRLSLGAELDRTRPSFDGDSIFNWFTQGPTTRFLGRFDYTPWKRLRTSASWGVRWFETEGDPYAFDGDRRVDRNEATLVGSLAGVLALDLTELSLSAIAEAGDRGHLSGADLRVERSLGGGRYDSLAILSLYDWTDPLRDDRDATSFSYVLGAGMRGGSELFGRSRFGLEWEHTMNRLVSQRFRVLATLELEVFR
jgi:hypothetical protein